MTRLYRIRTAVAASPAEREIARHGWERRGLLGRLVRTELPQAPAAEQPLRRAA
jgi:hypothetical protein